MMNRQQALTTRMYILLKTENFTSHEQEQDFDPHYYYDNYHDNPVVTDMPSQDDLSEFTELQNFQTTSLQNTGK